jgi:hypothetical protein
MGGGNIHRIDPEHRQERRRGEDFLSSRAQIRTLPLFVEEVAVVDFS